MMDHAEITPRQKVENYHFPADAHLLDPASGLLYCAIPKVGCSTGKRWFLSIAEPGILDGPSPPDIHSRCRERWALALIEDRAERARGSLGGLAFAAVRHPLDRIASAYTEKFAAVYRRDLFLPANELAARVEAARADGTTGVSFAEFVEHLTAAPDEALDSHWRPQASFLRLRNDYLIAPIERLTDTLGLIGESLGHGPVGPDSVNLTPYSEDPAADPPEVLSKRSSTDLYAADIRPRAAGLYTDRLRDLVLARFAADVDLYRRAREAWSESSVRRSIHRFRSPVRGVATRAASPTMSTESAGIPARS